MKVEYQERKITHPSAGGSQLSHFVKYYQKKIGVFHFSYSVDGNFHFIKEISHLINLSDTPSIFKSNDSMI